MKKVLALIIAAMMIISMIPVMAITSSAADVDGDWDTYRSAAGYEPPKEGEEESYTPAPGYEYTDEGFHMTSADYAGCTPFGTIQSKEKVALQDGVYMELRVDDYAYGGPKGTDDHWISFHIWDSHKIAPGNVTDYGQGWLSLNRTPGAGGAGTIQSFICSSEGAGQFWHQGDISATPVLDDEGKEIYTFEVSYDGSNYTISVCGVPVQGAANITNHLNNLDPNGEFYVGVTFHAGTPDTKIEATILKFGTSAEDASKPVGSDSELPEENVNVKAPIADPSTIETNMPCLLFDAAESSHSGKMSTSGMELQAQGDNSYKIVPSVPTGYHLWSIRNSLSFDAADFPVIGVFVYDPNQIFETCTLRYCAGQNMTADNVHILNFSIYDDGAKYYGENDEYTFMVVDMKALLDEEAFADGWTGRINSLRFDYNGLYINDPADPETDYFFMQYAGIFRSVEEAYAYQLAYSDVMDFPENTQGETEAPTEAPTDAPAEGTDAPAEGTDAPAEGTDAPAEGTQAPVETAAPEKKGGCGSVIGSVAVLLSAAAAAVVLKKKD